MQNTNTINGLFHIPDEGSLIKKLILTHPPVFNPQLNSAYELLQKQHPTLQFIQKEHYVSLILPTVSEGLTLEAMLITTEDKGKRYFSIYHRLHFEHGFLIEADAFLRVSAVLVNIPLNDKVDALASLLNYQVQEAFNIEITMLSLADSNLEIPKTNILPFVMNAISRHMLASTLDDITYTRPLNSDDLGRLVAKYCDIPLHIALEGIAQLENWEEDIKLIEEAFIPEFSSSTACMMLFILEQKTAQALLEHGGFGEVKSFLLKNSLLFSLHHLNGEGKTLGDFKKLV